MNHAATPSNSSPTRVRFVVLTFICTLAVLTYLDRICISRVHEDIQRDLLISDFQMGLVFSSFIVGYLRFEVPGGWMGDRWGSRRVLTRIVLWWSMFTALTGSVFYFSWDLFAQLGWEPFVVYLGDRYMVPLPGASRGSGSRLDLGPAGRCHRPVRDRPAHRRRRLASRVLGAGGNRDSLMRPVRLVVP